MPNILLVEDSKINVMVAQSMLKQLGHTIDVVNNGVEAVCAVQKRSYDLVLMDVCMPVMDGLQATRLIRSFEETGNWDAAVKVGIEQDSSQPDDGKCVVRECYANGMDSFVSKPVTFQNLKECLEQYLP
ncbi:hypothetical protein F3Y22_tig00117047pilonHSYRG00141 [Hibiscus syriacus]|uniref:Response regulatory domain-containing protein n=1 Tax=Hibiscus syriacus TaxID=106335 RepID=A0A6A2W9V4_HIBSY|nr:hypothetical protein F3Y22_tig00117047pilonHSYRG00141 [Hibiscus syriacus]